MARVNGSSNGYVDSSTETESEAPMYMAAQPKLSKQYSAFASILRHGQPTKIEAAVEKYQKMTWQQKLSMILVAILWRLNKYLKLLGFIVEWTLNLLNLNGGPFGLLYKVFLLKWGEFYLTKLLCPLNEKALKRTLLYFFVLKYSLCCLEKIISST